jgi:hypothetical protein
VIFVYRVATLVSYRNWKKFMKSWASLEFHMVPESKVYTGLGLKFEVLNRGDHLGYYFMSCDAVNSGRYF